MRLYLNDDWKFGVADAAGEITCETPVRLPHTTKELPLHYCDEHEYQMVCGYKKILDIPAAWEGRELLLTIDGAAHVSEVYLNGTKLGEHRCGYTAYTVNLKEAAIYGGENVLFIRVDSNESLNIPPFGFVIDYMTYGGIYRDVYLDVKEPSYISDIFVTTRLAEMIVDDGVRSCRKSKVLSEITLEGSADGLTVRQFIGRKGEELKEAASWSVNGEDVMNTSISTGQVTLWDVEHPALYELKTCLYNEEELLDEKTVTFGYRKAAFKEDGFYLNGRKLKIRGLNRHQSYPYVGYAMPESMQKYDADILKKELGLNAVRTSHYPQSHYFLDRCDEIGLLVFTEIPGWQHIGDAEWKDQAVQNVRDMVLQYRNHTSIILWGVRINESVDDDEFYERTNAAARELDPTRQTGGVRCYKKSHLYEDVYTYNDFVHSGGNQGCERKSDVTSDKKKPYMITEYMGHMYPTKAFDSEEHRTEHAIRHAVVLNAVNGQEDISGSFGWCMFDYNTHKDFGSGDRICYHGVMDFFRNPKLAAAVYASQQEETPVLEINSSLDIGEHPGSNRGEMYIFTNADSVRMYKNDYFLKEYSCRNKDFPNLKKPPIRVDDYIGNQLLEKENMPAKQAEDVKAILNEVAEFGMYRMSKSTMLKAGKMMLLYHMKMDDAVQLYNKYIGNWGGASVVYRFDAITDGQVVKSVTKAPMTQVSLKVTASHTTLHENTSYDVAAIRIMATDDAGNVLPFYNDAVILETEGDIELIGPEVISLSGGMGGAYVKTKGTKGTGMLTIRPVNGMGEIVEFTIQ